MRTLLCLFVLTETWLSGKTQDSDIVYNLFRMDRTSEAGGVVILVRDHLSAQIIAVSTVPKCSEYMVLDLCLGDDVHCTVIGIHRPQLQS